MENISKNKVLFIQPSLQGVGGIEKVIPTVAQSLAEKSFLVSAFVAYGRAPEDAFWQKTQTLNEQPSKSLWNKITKTYNRVRHLLQYIKKVSPDIIIVSAHGMAVTVLAAKSLGLISSPVLVYAHEGIDVSGPFYGWLIKKLYPKAEGVICVSAGIKSEIESKLSIGSEKTVLAYNSLPLSFNTNLEDDVSVVYPEPIFVTASRLEYIKGVDVLVDFFCRYATVHEGTLLILGNGSLQQELQQKVQKADLEGRIIFLGFQENVQLIVANSAAYLSCAPSEPFGLSLLEAISLGVPVIVTDVQYGPREIMNVTSEEVIEYPYVTPYGYLLSPTKLIEKEVLYRQFESALLNVQKQQWDITTLKARAADFGPNEQALSIISLIKKCYK